jgi:SET domain-containing protein
MKNKKEKLLENLENTFCRLKRSKIEGIGVIAIRDIPQDTNPFIGVQNQKWQKFKLSELSKMDKEILKMIDSFFTIEKDETVYVPENGLNGMDISFFLNNSNKPNLKVVGGGKKEAIEFKTTKKIKKGEELTVSYSTFDEKYK